MNNKKVINVHRVYVKGYSDAGASTTKRALKGFRAQSGTPIEDIDFNNYTLRQRGRMLYMSSPIAAAAVNINRIKVVGPGLHMKCNINREKLGLSDEAAKEWQKKRSGRVPMNTAKGAWKHDGDSGQSFGWLRAALPVYLEGTSNKPGVFLCLKRA